MTYAYALSVLGDPTRRAIFERLRGGPQPVSALARGLPVSRPAVSQHLRVLKEAGLVRDRAEGTRRIYQIDPAGLGAIRAWLDGFWGTNLASFAAALEAEEGKEQTMTTAAKIAPVMASVDVPLSPEKAFALFATQMTDWWPAEYAMVPTPRQVVVEPKKGGRWYEKGADGSERLVATVTGWEPGRKATFDWHIDATWQSDPKLATEVDVRFVPAGNATKLTLEHRNMERFGEQAEATRAALSGPGGWGDILAGFARFAAGAKDKGSA